MNTNFIFTPDQAAKIVREYQSGLTVEYLAKKYYTCNPTIINYLKRNGIERRTRGGKVKCT